MELLQLQYFITTAKTNNLSQTARIYGVPPSSISQCISRLERELGVQLFDRGNNKLRLNADGELFARQAEAALGLLRAAEDELRNRDVFGEIRLLVLEHRSTIIDIVARFKNKYPQVTFSVDLANAPEQGYKYDCVISSNQLELEGFSQKLLVEEEIRLGVGRRHPLFGKARVSLADLQGETLLFTRRNSVLHQLFVQQLATRQMPPPSLVFCNDLFCIKKYVDMNWGVAPVPRLAWRELFPVDAGLIPFADPLLTRKTFLYINSLYQRKTETVFTAFLLEEFQRISEGGPEPV